MSKKIIKTKSNYAFIDNQNLYLGVKRMGWKLDYKKFRIFLQNKYKVEKAFIFIGSVIGNENLYKELQEYGYILIFKPTLEIKKDNQIIIKGNVDAELVLHSMIQFESFDKAIIVSGDGDFHCLIEYFVGKNKLEACIIPNEHKYSALLRRFISKLKFLNDFEDRLGKKKK